MHFGASRNTARRAGFATVLVVALAGFWGCGGGDSEEPSAQPTADQAADTKAVVAVGDQLNRAFRKKNAAGICGLIVPESLEAQYKTKEACVRHLKVVLARNNTESPNFDLQSVTIDGDTAVAESGPDEGQSLDLKKIDGQWYIDITPQEQSSGSDSTDE